MKVWTVWRTIDNYDERLYGRFSTKELAKQCVSHAKKYEKLGDYCYEIREWELDREYPDMRTKR